MANNSALDPAICQLSEVATLGAMLTISAGSESLGVGDLANIGRVISRKCDECADWLEAEQRGANRPVAAHVGSTELTATAEATRTPRPVSLVMHEALATLRAAEFLLDEHKGDPERIEQASGLVDAAITVLLSFDGEGSRHG